MILTHCCLLYIRSKESHQLQHQEIDSENGFMTDSNAANVARMDTIRKHPQIGRKDPKDKPVRQRKQKLKVARGGHNRTTTAQSHTSVPTVGSPPPLSQPSSSNQGTTPQTQQKRLKSPSKRGRPWRV
ncbi:hypothetical protein ACE6H2_006609 [Prunus campanulata]